MAFEDLTVIGLQKISAVAVQHAGLAAIDRGRVAVGNVEPMARRFDPEDLDLRLVEERVKKADRVRAAADAGDQTVRQTAFEFEHLRPRLLADHALEVAHHRRIGMRAGDGADAIIGVMDVGHPIARAPRSSRP